MAEEAAREESLENEDGGFIKKKLCCRVGVFGKIVSTDWLPTKEGKEVQRRNGLQNGGYDIKTGLSNFKENN